MKLINFIFVCIVCSQLGTSLIITEVYYDAFDESNSEVIELYNDNSEDLNLSGHTIITNSGTSNNITLPNVILRANSYFLIADVGFSQAKDDSGWPLADYEQTFNLKNSDGGIILYNGSIILDKLGWGESSENYFFGTPANEVVEGKSLSRKKIDFFINDFNNLQDFMNSIPNFKNSNFQEPIGQEINSEFTIQVSNVPPFIESITLHSDTENLAEVIPVPGGLKQVFVEVNVSDANGDDDINEVFMNFQNETYLLVLINKTYHGSFFIEHHIQPGIYELNVTVSDSGFNVSESTNFKILGLAAVSIVNSEGAILPGVPSLINISLKNLGNVIVDFKIELENLNDGTEDVDVLNFSLNFMDVNYLAGETIPLELTPGEDLQKMVGLNLLVRKARKGVSVGRAKLIAIAR